jgi:hypothetical protein
MRQADARASDGCVGAEMTAGKAKSRRATASDTARAHCRSLECTARRSQHW